MTESAKSESAYKEYYIQVNFPTHSYEIPDNFMFDPLVNLRQWLRTQLGSADSVVSLKKHTDGAIKVLINQDKFKGGCSNIAKLIKKWSDSLSYGATQ